MLLGNTFYLILTIGLPIVVCLPLSWYGWKRWGKYGALPGLLLGGFGYGAFQATSAHLYVVTGKKELYDYRTFGTVDYRMTNGKIITIPYAPRMVQIINSSDGVMALEEIAYGGHGGHRLEPGGWYIDPYDTASFPLPQVKIDFLFDQYIPQAVKVYGRTEYKYWLHSAE